MLPLMEVLMKAGNGDALQRMQENFDLDESDARNALAAVLPAFSKGLKNNTREPQDFGAFMQALSDGSHARYVENPAQAFDQAGLQEGNAILGHLFGSKQTSRAIADHAAGKSGVSASTIKKMLPAIAAMVMGGISGQADEKANMFGGGSGSGGIIGTILKEMMKGGAGMPQGGQRRQAPSGRGNNPLGDILDQMMGGGIRGGGSYQQGGDNPLGKIFEEMLSGRRSQYDGNHDGPNQRRQPRFDETANPPDSYGRSPGQFEDIGPAGEEFENRYRPNQQSQLPQSEGGLEDLFGDMFETGNARDNEYERGIDDIFDQIMKRR